MVKDRPGVLAELTAALRDGDVSIESLIQQGRSQSGGEVMVAMVTHEGPERCVAKALALLEGSDSLSGEPLVLPILPLRGPRSAANYAKVWMEGGSPLLVYTQRLAAALQERLPHWRVTPPAGGQFLVLARIRDHRLEHQPKSQQ